MENAAEFLNYVGYSFACPRETRMEHHGEEMIPGEGVELNWKRFCLRLNFYPRIKLTRRDCLSFAETLSEYVDLDDVRLGTSEWNLSGGARCDGVGIQIAENTITLDAHNPPNNLEFYEHRFKDVLSLFGRMFSPAVALDKRVIATSLIDLSKGVDARSFLGSRVMLMHPHKLAPIDRPLHLLGVRLFFPEYEKEDGTTVDWSVNVRVESCFGLEDSGRLFLEAISDWDAAVKWDDKLVENAVECLGTTTKFMQDRVVKFLRQPPFPDDDEN